MLISLHKESEELLRRLAKERYGGKKGALSAVIEDALPALVKELKHQQAVDQLINNMKKGLVNLKEKKAYEKREDIYAERLRKQGLD